MKDLYSSIPALLLLLAHGSEGQVGNVDSPGVSPAVFDTAPINATGQATIDGVNILQPYPAPSSEKWTFSIQVRDGIPLTGNGQEGQQVAGTTIQLKAPDSFINKTESNNTQVVSDPSWYICQHWWIRAKLRIDRDVVDPTCEGTLPDRCINDIKRMITTGFNSNPRRNFRCESLSIPDSCGESFGNATQEDSAVTLGMFIWVILRLSPFPAAFKPCH
jgi:hypothetical protein